MCVCVCVSLHGFDYEVCMLRCVCVRGPAWVYTPHKTEALCNQQTDITPHYFIKEDLRASHQLRRSSHPAAHLTPNDIIGNMID